MAAPNVAFAQGEDFWSGPTQMVAVDAVSGLEHVEPESWARRALSTLARGKLLQGVPGLLLQGERPLNRLEFAAALAAALDALDTLIVGGEEHLTHTDLAVLGRLQADFEPELALLRVRTAALEAKASNLEANLFSPTTKLDGSVVLALTGGGGGAGSRTPASSNRGRCSPRSCRRRSATAPTTLTASTPSGRSPPASLCLGATALRLPR
ncbi:MAG: iron uptake porin [Aphanocapsa lilacina HA4352-LM1]|nr:iron uptake porin [Aphanocapsa lilacina HA4352-LM1]